MHIARRHHAAHDHDAWLGIGGFIVMLLLIATVLLMSTRSTQMAVNDVAPFERSIGMPPFLPQSP
jgi:hypothetical protein